ncbi:MAG: class I SAM-dependent methyltransferase [Chloroflexaceae bacterium]|nr:class I SAM-dependent methyltransferase [Chloroflexaceae bacterium]
MQANHAPSAPATPGPVPDDAGEQLASAIAPWLQHMVWRRDFNQWRERRIHQEHYQRDRLALLERTVGPLTGTTILDLGAGMGGFAVAAAQCGGRVIACEYHRAYCEITALRAERYRLALPVCAAAGESLPFPAASFDAVVSWDVMEHVRSPTHMLAEIARVLRPGGCAVLTVINRRAWVDPHYHMWGLNWLPRPWAERVIQWRGRSKAGAAFQDMQRLSEMHYFHYHEFVSLAQRHGFEVRDLREELLAEGHLPSPRWSRRAMRAVLRVVGFEHLAYRLQRRWTTAMFELALDKKP